jgi:hypothetical protein
VSSKNTRPWLRAHIRRRSLKPILHLDLKSLNVLVGERFTLKLTDFGESRLCDAAGFVTSTPGRGTVNWMAPEVMREAKCQFSHFSSLMQLLEAEREFRLQRFAAQRRLQSGDGVLRNSGNNWLVFLANNKKKISSMTCVNIADRSTAVRRDGRLATAVRSDSERSSTVAATSIDSGRCRSRVVALLYRSSQMSTVSRGAANVDCLVLGRRSTTAVRSTLVFFRACNPHQLSACSSVSMPSTCCIVSTACSMSVLCRRRQRRSSFSLFCLLTQRRQTHS